MWYVLKYRQEHRNHRYIRIKWCVDTPSRLDLGKWYAWAVGGFDTEGAARVYARKLDIPVINDLFAVA